MASTVKTRRSSKSGMSGLFGKQTQAEIANADSATQYRALKEDVESKSWKKKQRGCDLGGVWVHVAGRYDEATATVSLLVNGQVAAESSSVAANSSGERLLRRASVTWSGTPSAVDSHERAGGDGMSCQTSRPSRSAW